MPGETESGWKWWIRYFVVPIIGGGGLTAIIVALVLRNPPGNNANNLSSTTSVTSATETLDHRSTPLTSSSPLSAKAARVNTPPVTPPGSSKVNPTLNINSRGEDNFRRLLGNASELLSVSQYGLACTNYLKAAQAIPPKFKGQVNWNLIAQAQAYYRGKDSPSCAKSFQNAFQNIKLD